MSDNKVKRFAFGGIVTASALGLLAIGACSPALAKGGGGHAAAHAAAHHPAAAHHFAQEHPRRAQVMHRDNGLKQHMAADRGHLGGHYGQLEHEANGIHHQERADARANGGHLTAAEQHQFNHEEAGLQQQMNRDYHNAAPKGSFAYNHPRRSQVLRDGNHMGNELANDKGNLGGHYGQLEKEDNSIRHQEQADAKANGGYITKGQERQLFSEQRNLQNQIHHDDK